MKVSSECEREEVDFSGESASEKSDQIQEEMIGKHGCNKRLVAGHSRPIEDSDDVDQRGVLYENIIGLK
jgi:hypothetical protein